MHLIYFDESGTRFGKAEWNIAVGAGAGLFEKLEQMPVKLGEIANLFVGLQTSADTVFLFKDTILRKSKTLKVWSKELDREVELETALLRPVIRSGQIGRYWAKPSALILFPYRREKEDYILIPEREMIAEFPRTWDYLRLNKKLLEEREDGKFAETGWWQLYPKNLDLWEQPKLMLPYLRLLLKQAEANPQQVQLDRTVIDPDRIRSMEHSRLAGLQVADAVASGFHFAVKVNRYGETEAGYLPHLKKSIYRHKGEALGYGLKVWPEDFATVKAKAPEALHLEGL